MSWVLFKRFELRDNRSHKTPRHSAHRTAAQHVPLWTFHKTKHCSRNVIWVFFFLVGLFFFFLQKDINTIHSILLDESECETIYLGQPNTLSSSLFLLENFGLSTSSIPQGASFLAAEKSSKNLQSSLHPDFRKKSVIKSVICSMCFLLLGWQSFCIFKEFSKLCVHRHTLNLDVLRLNICLPSLKVAWTVAGLSDCYGKTFLETERCFGFFWFVFTSEELRQVNGEVSAGCPCRKCPCTFNIFSQKPARIILGFDFFPEHIYQLKTTCLLSLQLFSRLWLLKHRKDVL